ncbi:MAG: regulatory protein RecX [Arenicellales bacterium]
MRAMDLLARREHGVKELSRKLINKGFDPELVEEVIESLVSDNLVSDRRFCESMVHSRFNRSHGPVKVRYELRSKGVADQIIESVMDELAPDWQQALVDLIKKKYAGSLSGTPAERAKKVRFLSSRGFPQEMIFFVMRDTDFDLETSATRGSLD